jgi:hypothetical protein
MADSLNKPSLSKIHAVPTHRERLDVLLAEIKCLAEEINPLISE